MPPSRTTVQWFSIQTLVNLQWKLLSRKWTPSGPEAGVLQIASDRDDRMGAIIKIQKNPKGFKQTPPPPPPKKKKKNSLDQNVTAQKSYAEFPSHKNFQRNYTAGIHGNHTRKLSAKISPPKKVPKSKILIPKRTFDHPCHIRKCKNTEFVAELRKNRVL